MSAINIQYDAAQRVASKIDPQEFYGDERAVGFDPMLLISLIGLAMQCWNWINRGVTSVDSHSVLVRECSEPHYRKRLEKRATTLYRRRSETKLTREQARQIASATLTAALESQPSEFAAFASASGMLTTSDINLILNDEEIENED